MKRKDIAAMETSSTSGIISIIDAHRIYDEVKRLRKLIKWHEKAFDGKSADYRDLKLWKGRQK